MDIQSLSFCLRIKIYFQLQYAEICICQNLVFAGTGEVAAHLDPASFQTEEEEEAEPQVLGTLGGFADAGGAHAALSTGTDSPAVATITAAPAAVRLGGGSGAFALVSMAVPATLPTAAAVLAPDLPLAAAAAASFPGSAAALRSPRVWVSGLDGSSDEEDEGHEVDEGPLADGADKMLGELTHLHLRMAVTHEGLEIDGAQLDHPDPPSSHPTPPKGLGIVWCGI